MINFDLAKYLTPVFVETGLGYGDGARKALLAGFERVISIEICSELIARFSHECSDGRMELVMGESPQALEAILSGLYTRATFWLDAHVDHQGAARLTRVKCPLMEEIRLIGEHRPDHIIMVDDRRLFRENERRINPLGWGMTVSERAVREAMLLAVPNGKFSLEEGTIPNDVIIIGGRT